MSTRQCQNCNDGEPATFRMRFIDGEVWYLCAPCTLTVRLQVSPEVIVGTTCIYGESDVTPEQETYYATK